MVAKAQPGRHGSSEERGRRREAPARPRAEQTVPELDPMIHERIRLGIVSALAVNDRLSFNELKRLLITTDGNLSVHARKLEEAGYLGCDKYFDGRVPKTEFWLTATGRKSLQRYLDHMEEIIRAARQG
jgi:DNA-binding HxlR family transcriptional regulator